MSVASMEVGPLTTEASSTASLPTREGRNSGRKCGGREGGREGGRGEGEGDRREGEGMGGREGEWERSDKREGERKLTLCLHIFRTGRGEPRPITSRS